MPDERRKTVWSSTGGDLRKAASDSISRASIPPQQQLAYLHRESGGRGGKVVSVVKNLVLSEEELKSLARTLKQLCGTGGTVKNGVIEIQGEHRDQIAEVLRGQGYRVKIAGG